MERSINIAALTAALGGRTNLPTPPELQQLIADLETEIFIRPPQLSQRLLDTAWYLHAVASVDNARELYSLPRQRQAFLVSAHIFDLALLQNDINNTDRLSMAFASCVGYRRGGRDPNATAIMNRVRGLIRTDLRIESHLATVAMEAGVAFLGFETRTLFGWLRDWRRQFSELSQRSGLANLRSTIFGPMHLAVLGASDLLRFFALGDRISLERGRANLRIVATGRAGPEDLNTRWVAAHLLAIADDGEQGSLWNPDIFPPDVTDLVRQSFTLGRPAVLTLWEPQRALLKQSPSPFDPAVRRMVLSVPTSGGKTAIAQMIAVEHLSRSDTGICYVAPTRSLGREVRRSMSSRIEILQKEPAPELPDFPTFVSFLAETDTYGGDVEVVTPERLFHMLRHEPADVLDRFGVFIFDEAQFIKETGRGFVLEAVISLLNYLTRSSDQHRIILISAAMGNTGTIAKWLDSSGEALQHNSDWRGPRQLHAVFSTEPDWDSRQVQPLPRARRWKYAHLTSLTGRLKLRMADGRVGRLQVIPDAEWILAHKTETPSFDGPRIKDQTLSTRIYKIAAEMISDLGHAGSVLVVANQRDDAQKLAADLAGRQAPSDATADLVDFAVTQLGYDHPLVPTLRRGVGFHHAGLPLEVLEALEDAVRSDAIKYLACTSTLTDGVNLPVRTVVIYDKTYEGQREDLRLDGARLVNAIGRAGRAGRETEGWIVLVRTAKPSGSEFSRLAPNSSDLEIRSTLLDDDALASLAEFENDARAESDKLFSVANTTASDFISYVWLILAIEEDRSVPPTEVDLDAVVTSTLGAEQSNTAAAIYRRTSEVARRVYNSTDPRARRRWSRSGTSISSARQLDVMAEELARNLLNTHRAAIPDQPWAALTLLAENIARLLALPEAKTFKFRVRPRGREFDVDVVAALTDWISGVSLPVMAETHLSQAPDASWRAEQIVDAVTNLFEHYLAWTAGALVELVNIHLLDSGIGSQLCPQFGQHIRYGIGDPRGLALMKSGIRSRRLAGAIASSLPDGEYSQAELRTYVASMRIKSWRDRYSATRSEVRDLLDFARPRYQSHLRSFLETGRVVAGVRLSVAVDNLEDAPLTLNQVPDEPQPATLGLYVHDTLVGEIEVADHNGVSSIIDTGLEFELSIVERRPGYPGIVISRVPE